MDTKTYTGGCHCGVVRFKVITDLKDVITCNCSMCAKAGTMLTFVPVDQFTLESGEEALSNYQFNKKVIDHLFCKYCGIKPFGKGTGPNKQTMMAVNVRCLDDYDKLTLEPVQVDGRSY